MLKRAVESIENRHRRISVFQNRPVFQTALSDHIKYTVQIYIFKRRRTHEIICPRRNDENMMVLNKPADFRHEFRLIHAPHRFTQLLRDLITDLGRCLFIFNEHACDRQVSAQSKFHVNDILREALIGKTEADKSDPFADELFFPCIQEGLCLSRRERTVKIENKTESVIHGDVRRSFCYLTDPDVAYDMSDRGRNTLCCAHFSIV